MSFDALTIGGLLAAVLSGGFLVGLVSHNDSRGRDEGPRRHGGADLARDDR
jgi:hypothetical protein